MKRYLRKFDLHKCLIAAVFVLAGNTALAQNRSQAWVNEIEGFQYFAVDVTDVDKSVEWYVKVFGLSKVDDTKADDDRWRIVNLRNDNLFVEIIRDNRSQKTDRAKGFAKVGFQIPDVRVVADRIAQAGQDRPRVIDFERHEVRIIQLRDPDNNIIQLFSQLR